MTMSIEDKNHTAHIYIPNNIENCYGIYLHSCDGFIREYRIEFLQNTVNISRIIPRWGGLGLDFKCYRCNKQLINESQLRVSVVYYQLGGRLAVENYLEDIGLNTKF